MSPQIYLDNNACTPLDDRVKTAIIEALPLLGGNPSSMHLFGKQAMSLILNARKSIARCLKVKASEILFTSGGTENVNMVMQGVAKHAKKGHIITSAAEHASVFANAKLLESNGFEVTFLQPGFLGATLPQAVQTAIRPDTKLIALMAVNNETGVKTDIEAIASIAAQGNIPFFVDAVALLGKEPLCIPPGVSAMGFSGHKIHAPSGIGFCYVKSGFKWMPLLVGGEQESGRRAGSENIIGIVALAKAMEILSHELGGAIHHMKALRDHFEELLMSQDPLISINGEGERICNTSNLSFHGIDGETLLIALSQQGIAASHGSACSSGALEPSRVLASMGLPLERVRSSLRFSFSRLNTMEEIEAAAAIIAAKIKQMRE